jgi:aspartate aminotransferase
VPNKLASRLDVVVPSATLAINAKAQAMRAQGLDVISFGAGEPDFDTPEYIRTAAHSAIDAGKTRYTPVSGIPELRKAIAEQSARERGTETKPENVVVTVGAKSALFNFALAALEPGDEVVIPAPFWVSYPEQVRIAGATPVFVPSTLDAGWKITPEALSDALTSKTKAVILCSPSNPTGAAYTAAQLAAFAEVLRAHDCWIVIDEIYGHLVYDGFEQRSLLSVAPDLAPRIVVIDGVSKTYAMTGWRIGWSIAPVPISKAMDMIQGQGTSSAATIAQFAAVEALRAPATDLERMRGLFQSRRDRLVNGLRELPGVRCAMPEGAFYAFPDVRAWIGKKAAGKPLENDDQIAAWLLDAAQIAVVPGGAFGAPGHLRLSYAVSVEQIDQALARMKKALASLA